MNPAPLYQPPPSARTLERFVAATTELLGDEGTATLRDHLKALAALAGADMALLYHGAAGAAEFELVASFGIAHGAVAGLGRTESFDAPAGNALSTRLAALGMAACWDTPLRADGDCIGSLVVCSRHWSAFHPDMLPVLRAASLQIALVLQRRLSEESDAKDAASPALPVAPTAEPLLFRRRRDRFIALLAHELRNPVAPIQSGLDVLATDRVAAPERLEIVRMMQRQVAQLAHLIDDFLDTARLDTGRLRAQRRPVALLETLVTATDSVEPAARARGQRIERSGWDARPVVVDADPVRLTQAFANLLAAGAAASPTDGTLTVRLDVGADAATIAFEDQGPPMNEDGVRRSTDAPDAQPENGGDGGACTAFGLVESLVAMNDGTVVGKNRDGGGGRVFTMTLPLAMRDVQPRQPPAGGGGRPSRRLLVVDDNHDAAESLGLLFQLDGHDVRLAHDGPEAVAAALAFDPEVIVMDLGLPGFSGHEAIMRIRSAPGPTRPAILALTGWGTRADRDASARAGADVHLVKPVTQADLTQAIESLLQGAEPLTPAR